MLLFPFLGCQPEETDETFVDVDLTYYFNIFKDEAALRDVVIDLSEIEGHITSITGTRVVGQCTRRENERNMVTVDRSYWRTISPLDKEFLVFHELGHCALNRDHLEEEKPDGWCLSIMGSGIRCQTNYNQQTRESYLDELFGL